MKRSKFLVFFITAIAVFAMVGLAFAANRVEVKVTSEPIQFHATCDKAGAFSLHFDTDTVLTSGDQITIDLPFGSTLCKDIDIEVSNGGSEAPWLAATVMANDENGPVYYIDDNANGDLTDDGTGIYFHIYGTAGSQRITLDVLGGGSMTVGPDPNDALVINFMDQKTNADFVNPGIYVEGTTPGVYDVDATLADNTLCINVSEFDQNTVDASFDSKNDKYTFIPSNPEIAHVVTATGYSLTNCAKQEAGRIIIGERAGQDQTEDCTYFDYETGSGYCIGTHTNHNRVLISATSAFAQASYQIKLEILTKGVYWSNETVGSEGFDTVTHACDDETSTSPVGSQANYTYLDPNGGTVDPGNVEIPHSGECDVATNAQAVTLTTDASDLGLVATDKVLWIDLPALNYDLDEITEGDEVEIRITLIKTPCGTLFSDTLVLGTLGCVPPSFSQSLLFPYFTEMSGDNYWDGIAITNLSGTDGTATLKIYEADGDTATMDVSVPAHSIYANTLDAMMPSMTQTGGTGSLGDERLYIQVDTDFSADGFAMIADHATGESMGYLPRQLPIVDGMIP